MAKLIDFPLGINEGETRLDLDPDTVLTEEKCKVYSLIPQDKEIVVPDDTWQCDCGCHLFYVNPEGWTCSNCGTYQIFKE